jgi:hypothetical protein
LPRESKKPEIMKSRNHEDESPIDTGAFGNSYAVRNRS